MAAKQNNRQVVFDTETTGMNENGPVYEGHRIIEIGCVEVVDRKLTGRTFHVYINPEQKIDEDAVKVHGITDERVKDEPKFAEIAQDFIEFIRGAELVAHNAAFDMSFINHELSLLKTRLPGRLRRAEDICSVTDSLQVAKSGEYRGRAVDDLGKGLPSRKNLDSLCNFYGVDTSSRTYHGALLDAELLADVFLKMTGGQEKFDLRIAGESGSGGAIGEIIRLGAGRRKTRVIRASEEEKKAHAAKCTSIGADTF